MPQISSLVPFLLMSLRKNVPKVRRISTSFTRDYSSNLLSPSPSSSRPFSLHSSLSLTNQRSRDSSTENGIQRDADQLLFQFIQTLTTFLWVGIADSTPSLCKSLLDSLVRLLFQREVRPLPSITAFFLLTLHRAHVLLLTLSSHFPTSILLILYSEIASFLLISIVLVAQFPSVCPFNVH